MKIKNIILLCFLVLKFLLQFFLISDAYELHRDEFLHLDQANHLAWGYLSVPPFTSWTSYLIQLLGNAVFWVKFFPAIYGALTILVVWKAIEALNGSLMALVIGSCCVMFSAILRMNTLYQPNSFDILSWTLVYYFLLKYVKTNHTKWLFFCAVFFALGFLNKYNIVFLLTGLVPALLLTVQRKIFAEPKLYKAILLCVLLIFPNLLWQYKNNFPIIDHLKELAEMQLVNVDRLEFLKAQLLFFIGALIVIIASLFGLLLYKPFKPYRFFFFSIFFTLIAFLIFKAKNYYAIGLYPIYIAFGSVYLTELLKKGRKKYIQPILAVVPILLFIPIYKVGFPNKSPEYILQHPEKYKKFGLLRWEDGKDHLLPQDFADMLGWKELASKVDQHYSGLPNKNKTLILCDNYGQAGAINYYSTQKLKAVSFSADYINWFNWSIKYENLIRVKEQKNAASELKKISLFFQNSILADSITNKYAREFGTTIFVFTGAKTVIRDPIRNEIMRRNNYQID